MFRKFALNCAISARKGAPNDGTDEFGTAPNIGYRRSKQNSDAAGFHYQWGRKEPFTFATSSLPNGVDNGKYPIKIYNKSQELIFQRDDGNGNTNMTPVGGVINQSTTSQSMIETIKKPSVFYGIWEGSVISLVGHSKEMFNYYWTSYSRGTDGKGGWDTPSFPNWHNTYLDGYIVLRSKSIYDPCPYGYRTPTNGTYNDFKANRGWVGLSYIGGVQWSTSWFVPIYIRLNAFYQIATFHTIQTGSVFSDKSRYSLFFNASSSIWTNISNAMSTGISVRCIEDAENLIDPYANIL